MLPTLVLLGALAAPPARLAVLDLTAGVGVTKELAQTLTSEVVSGIRRKLTDTKVMGSDDVRMLLRLQAQKVKLGCVDVACLAEIGGALGATKLVTGTLSRLGDTYAFELRLVDSTRAVVVRQSSQKLKGQRDDALFDSVGRAVDEIFPAAPLATPSLAVATPAANPPAARSHVLSLVLWIGAAAAVGVALGGYFGPVQSFQSAKSNRTPESSAQASSLATQANVWGDVAIVTSVVAAGATVGGDHRMVSRALPLLVLCACDFSASDLNVIGTSGTASVSSSATSTSSTTSTSAGTTGATASTGSSGATSGTIGTTSGNSSLTATTGSAGTTGSTTSSGSTTGGVIFGTTVLFDNDGRTPPSTGPDVSLALFDTWLNGLNPAPTIYQERSDGTDTTTPTPGDLMSTTKVIWFTADNSFAMGSEETISDAQAGALVYWLSTGNKTLVLFSTGLCADRGTNSWTGGETDALLSLFAVGDLSNPGISGFGTDAGIEHILAIPVVGSTNAAFSGQSWAVQSLGSNTYYDGGQGPWSVAFDWCAINPASGVDVLATVEVDPTQSDAGNAPTPVIVGARNVKALGMMDTHSTVVFVGFTVENIAACGPNTLQELFGAIQQYAGL